MSKVTTLEDVKTKLREIKSNYQAAKKIDYNTNNYVPTINAQGQVLNDQPSSDYQRKSNDLLKDVFEEIANFSFSQTTFDQDLTALQNALNELKTKFSSSQNYDLNIAKTEITRDAKEYTEYVTQQLVLCIKNLQNDNWETQFPVTIEAWLKDTDLRPVKQQIVSFLQSVIRCPYYSD